VCLFLALPRQDLNNVNATVRWTVAADGSTEANLYFLSTGKKMQTNLAGTVACTFNDDVIRF